MTKEEILAYFSDLNEVYNNPNKFHDLKIMLEELTETKGEWIGGDINSMFPFPRCSNCGKTPHTHYIFPFCPHCGIKMKIEKEETR